MTPSVMTRALDAYAATTRAATSSGPSAAEAGAPSFAGMLRAELGATVTGLRAGEAATIAGVDGTMGMQAVVETVAQAELALQKVTAVRDRVIAAYQEIMRMPM